MIINQEFIKTESVLHNEDELKVSEMFYRIADNQVITDHVKGMLARANILILKNVTPTFETQYIVETHPPRQERKYICATHVIAMLTALELYELNTKKQNES